jgi:hypothetical protein
VNDDVLVVPVVVPVVDTGTNVDVTMFDVVTTVDPAMMTGPVEVVTVSGAHTHGDDVVGITVLVSVPVVDVVDVKRAEVVVVFVVVVVVVCFAQILMVVRPDVSLAAQSVLSLHQFVSHRLKKRQVEAVVHFAAQSLSPREKDWLSTF